MASKKDNKKQDTEQKQNAQAFEINMQYVKDLSFESPNAPFILAANKQPKVDLTVNINVNKINENAYEVVLHITAKAVSEDTPVFMADVMYAGLFNIPDIDDEQRNLMLFVFCPNLLFPFARRIIADATRDGGFPPLMINPIDFMALYKQKQEAGESPKPN